MQKNSSKDFSSPISINVIFDKNLEKITGTSGHTVVMSTGANFMFLLNSIFMEYPKMMKVCKPGELGFTINGYPPKEYSPLFDGDEVVFIRKV